MRLLSATFENFRLLKDLDIEFSTDPEKSVTVLRAANESGKTTMLTGLQWCLFGDRALPGGGKSYRMHPLDAPTESGTKVDICVAIDFEAQGKTSPRQYRIIRSTTESVDGGEWSRASTSVNLFRITRNGAQPLDNPEAHIKPHLPQELREVFFTDGDRALSFIEGTVGEQTKRVENAIRSLLGLDVVERAIGHAASVTRQLNKKVKGASGDKEQLDRVSSEIGSIQEKLPELEKNLKGVRQKVVQLATLEKEADANLSEALRRGNREELARELASIKKSYEVAERSVRDATRDHANLFKSEMLARQLLAPTISTAKGILDDLHDRGKIPNQTVPVLEERLTQAQCICGESLDPRDGDGKRRVDHIRHLIEASRNADAIQEKITALFYSSKELLRPVGPETWIDEYNEVFQRRQQAESVLNQLGERHRALEKKIEEIPEIDIQQLRDVREQYSNERREADRQEVSTRTKVQDLKERLGVLEKEQGKLLQSDSKGLQILAELNVAADLQGVLESALESMKTDELARVSDEMNKMFLEMIGADADQKERAIIVESRITEDFRIEVVGQNERQLYPSQDLNGASRRALTVAFILALTIVSEVEAPNVIDTPLGMTSGYVKRAILRIAAEKSTQLILFLTHDEIAGCEDILDKVAGKVLTLTNPIHFPRILANDPEIESIEVLQCECDHRSHCKVCERRIDAVA